MSDATDDRRAEAQALLESLDWKEVGAVIDLFYRWGLSLDELAYNPDFDVLVERINKHLEEPRTPAQIWWLLKILYDRLRGPAEAGT